MLRVGPEQIGGARAVRDFVSQLRGVFIDSLLAFVVVFRNFLLPYHRKATHLFFVQSSVFRGSGNRFYCA